MHLKLLHLPSTGKINIAYGNRNIDINEIKSYFEFIDRISFLKKFLNINIYCENVDINKKIIDENINIKNLKNIKKIDLTNEELLMMNYNYVNTNYFYLNILLK